MEENLVDLPFFVKNGFFKKKCKACGKVFWTLKEDQEYCGDQPCTDYSFIRRPVKAPISEITEVRKAFIEFFKENGHSFVKRYPVVARWRDDVYLVGASIYDFQPWVTQGIIPPPANPLVISQPSIRLTDIDNVGKTGRHLTGFEMMAHHAFNIGGMEIYWANETVEYAFRVLTEAYKIPPEEISFKFDWWSGGGNAGEDYEVLVRGLEVATLVFMHYKVENGKVIPMPSKIVDTGYGLERLVWLFKGNPTVYDAVFPDVIKYLKKKAGIKDLPREIIDILASKLGQIDYKEPEKVAIIKEKIALELGLDVSNLNKLLEPHENIYALADHTRTLVWMLGDGIVPSNTGAGYLARLLIRRSIRYLSKLNLEIPLSELISMQIKIWSPDFPEYVELEDTINEMIDYEEQRYKKTLTRGCKLLSNKLKKMKQKGLKELPVEDLILLYDSHGLSPDIVSEISKEYNISVSIPPDFFSRVAARHEKPYSRRKEVEVPSLEELRNLQPTKLLYYEDPETYNFTAKILAIIDNRYIILDQTSFYPIGGGQPFDTGILKKDDRECKVIRVFKVGNTVIHECDQVPFKEGDIVEGIVDRERREALKRSHTATHIILGAARSVLGPQVWQAGAEKGVDKNRLDITYHRPISERELRKIEMLANKIVVENRKVNVKWMNRNEAEAKYGFVIYQGGVVPSAKIRIVEIEDWDVEACGGLHCKNTGEVGLIKIVGSERIQDGVSRFVYKVGLSAIEYIQESEKILKSLSNILETQRENILKKVEELISENYRLRKLLEDYEKRELSALKDKLLKHAKVTAGFKVIISQLELPHDKMLKLAIKIIKTDPEAIVLLFPPRGMRGPYVIMLGEKAVEKGYDARTINILLLKNRVLEGKGGGKVDLVRGYGMLLASAEEILEILQRK